MPDQWQIEIRRQALRTLETLVRPVRNRIADAIDRLANDPRPHGCLKLRGHAGTYRLRVGDYRIIYCVDDHEKMVTVLQIKHRQSAYKD